MPGARIKVGFATGVKLGDLTKSDLVRQRGGGLRSATASGSGGNTAGASHDRGITRIGLSHPDRDTNRQENGGRIMTSSAGGIHLKLQ